MSSSHSHTPDHVPVQDPSIRVDGIYIGFPTDVGPFFDVRKAPPGLRELEVKHRHELDKAIKIHDTKMLEAKFKGEWDLIESIATEHEQIKSVMWGRFSQEVTDAAGPEVIIGKGYPPFKERDRLTEEQLDELYRNREVIRKNPTLFEQGMGWSMFFSHAYGCG